MIIYPAIDLQQGRVVRVRQGDTLSQTVYSDDPVAIAQQWVAQGAEWLHLANLDGAFGATKVIQLINTLPDEEILPANLQALKEIRQQVSVSIQYAGGLRSLESIRIAFELGADRIVLGNVAVEKPGLVCEAVKKWGAERIAVSLETKDGIVAKQGWQTSSGVDVIEIGHRLYALGARKVLLTAVSQDGTPERVNAAAIARLGDSTGLHVIARGGVAGLHDLKLLKEHEYYNIEGVVIGQALYRGTLDLKSAIGLGHAPLSRKSAGIIPYRNRGGEAEILLIYNYALEQWQLPRGHIEEYESSEDCAQREFDEQTGLRLEKFHAAPVIPLEFVRQFREYRVNRSIVFFLGQVADGEIDLTNENHCESLWASPDEAISLLSEAGPEQLPALQAALKHLNIEMND